MYHHPEGKVPVEAGSLLLLRDALLRRPDPGLGHGQRHRRGETTPIPRRMRQRGGVPPPCHAVAETCPALPTQVRKQVVALLAPHLQPADYALYESSGVWQSDERTFDPASGGLCVLRLYLNARPPAQGVPAGQGNLL